MEQPLTDIDKIRQLIEMMVANDLVEISLRDGEEEINLRRPHASASVPTVTGVPGPAAVHLVGPSLTGPPPAALPQVPAAAKDDALVEIVSPMVGTFYASPDPDSPPFVDVGRQVQPGTVLCILEAMKVFNEIKSEVSGIIERILAKNAQAVEYGQPLFLVRPL